jgi:hypothetical protein
MPVIKRIQNQREIPFDSQNFGIDVEISHQFP